MGPGSFYLAGSGAEHEVRPPIDNQTMLADLNRPVFTVA